MSKESKKSLIIEELRKNGCRITNQRQILIDIILEDECSSCKEIYYQAGRMGSAIGMATVYRMVQILEDMELVHKEMAVRL